MKIERRILRPYGMKADGFALADSADLEDRRTSPLAFKADEKGRISGYGSVFGVLDSYREVVEKGAFAESIKELKAEGSLLPMLWQHRSGEPLGVWDEFDEDEKGLKIAGGVVMESPTAAERFAFVKAGAVRGLSIGYYVLEDSFNEKERIRTLKRLELVEVSVVTFPANREALANPVKAKLRAGRKASMREFEEFVRNELRVSKADATLIASKGFKAWLDRRESGAGDDDGRRESGSAPTTDLKAALGDLADLRADLSQPLFGD